MAVVCVLLTLSLFLALVIEMNMTYRKHRSVKKYEPYLVCPCGNRCRLNAHECDVCGHEFPISNFFAPTADEDHQNERLKSLQ